MPYFYDDIESVYERSTLFVYSTTRMRMRLIWCVHVCVFTVCTNEHVYMYGFVCKSACVRACACRQRQRFRVQAKKTEIHIHPHTHALTHTHPKVWVASRSWNLWIPGKANPELNIGMLFVCLLACVSFSECYFRFILCVHQMGAHSAQTLKFHQFIWNSFVQFDRSVQFSLGQF